MKTLFINSCVRADSRTLRLARYLLTKLGGDVTEVELQKENIAPLTRDALAHRDLCVINKELDDPQLRYAVQFAKAESIVIAAPFWDLSFPSLLKNYIEAITVSGLTFTYENGVPSSMCSAKKLYFVSTSGGPFTEDFGFNYIKALAQNFYGIPEITCFKAEYLDVIGADVESTLKKVMEDIDSTL